MKTPLTALEKLMRYCVYQERCHQEVRKKLKQIEVYGEEADEIIVELIQQNFLNEERFAKAFAGGKFRINKWGRNKIIQHLKQKQISDYCIQKGLAEIDADAYETTLAQLIEKKSNSLQTEKNLYLKKQKIAKWLYQKGYENDLIWQQINLFFP